MPTTTNAATTMPMINPVLDPPSSLSASVADSLIGTAVCSSDVADADAVDSAVASLVTSEEPAGAVVSPDAVPVPASGADADSSGASAPMTDRFTYEGDVLV